MMTEWSWEGTDYNTISLTINIGNATNPLNINQTEIIPEPKEDEGPSLPYEHMKAALIAIVAGVISFLTIVGNIMVMVSFKIDKQLQTISNYFLFSLAVADLIIGAFSVPLFTVQFIMKRWPFSRHLCDVWLAIDYLASNASVWNLVVISVDRYFSVTRPLSYRATRTTMKAIMLISCAWTLSCVMWVTPIYAWPYIEGKSNFDEKEGNNHPSTKDCYVQFVETNRVMSLLCAVLAFYLPVTIMCCLYVRVWWETVKRQRDLVHLQAGKKSSRRSNSSTEEDAGYSNRLSVGTLQSQMIRGDRRSRILTFCCQLCWRQQPTPAETEGTVQAESMMPLKQSRSFNALCSADSLKQTNGYKTTSRSTDDLIEEIKNCKADSVYTILIQFPATSLPDTAGDTTSITMLSDTDQTETGTHARLHSRSSSGCSVPAATNITNTNKVKLRSFSCGPDAIDLNTRIVPKSYVKSVSQATSATPASSLPRKNKLKKATQEKRQERKAAKTLSAILLVFILTWTPYNVLAVMKGILGPEQSDKMIPEMLWDIAYCLCYINSTINPFCYALCNAAFRRTYIRILTFKWRSSHKLPGNTYYYG